MTHASLFSGIGGFDLAAEWAGWQNLFHCEWNPFGQKVLKHHFPNSISYNDITKTDFTIHRGQVDILTGGFPCQPYSSAGKRLGKEDERHLWPEMLRTIREVQPRWVVGENVRGLTNWNGGMVFDEVQSDLENQGYEVTPYLLPAAAVNAPHRRDRIWFVAYSTCIRRREDVRISNRESNEFNKISEESNAPNTDGNGFNQCNGKHEINSSEGREYALGDINESNVDGNVADTYTTRCENRSKQHRWQQTQNGERKYCTCGYCIGINKDVTNTKCKRLERQHRQWEGCTEHRIDKGIFIGTEDKLNVTNTTSTRRREDNRQRESGFFNKKSKTNEWQNFPTQSPICGGDDGLPRELDGITFSKWRQESIKAYGNAIVPQVAFQIFKAINQYEAL